ncbi:hypothetical protein Tco_1135221 [Tanacetum coccineum]
MANEKANSYGFHNERVDIKPPAYGFPGFHANAQIRRIFLNGYGVLDVRTTQSNSKTRSQPPDPVAAELATIAKKLESIHALQKDVAPLKSQSHNRDRSSNGSGKQDVRDSYWHHQRYHPHNKIAFLTFSDEDSRGWILKAEKYFCYYDIPEEEKVDVASMHLEGNALDFYSWVSTNQTMEYLKQTGTVGVPQQPQRRTKSGCENSETKNDVQSDADRKSCYLRDECYLCGETYGLGHQCKMSTLKVMEVEEEPYEQPTNEVDYIAVDANDVAEISLHANHGKPHPRTIKVQVFDSSRSILYFEVVIIVLRLVIECDM